MSTEHEKQWKDLQELRRIYSLKDARTPSTSFIVHWLQLERVLEGYRKDIQELNRMFAPRRPAFKGQGVNFMWLGIAFDQARRALGLQRKQVPSIRVRKVDFQLYALWAELDGKRIADCIHACCPVCARAEFMSKHFRNEGLDELNRLYSLADNRTENR